MKVNINDIVNVTVSINGRTIDAVEDASIWIDHAPEDTMEVKASKRPEPIIEEVCEVCGKYVRVGYHHNTCYTVVASPPFLEDNSGEIVVRFE